MDIEARTARLEEHLTWLQQHATEQDRIISTQSFEIDLLKNQLILLKEQLSHKSNQSNFDVQNEKPPHY
ncbi:putative coiled-coil protein SlyX [Ereboglobus sp. PH5-5]|uniref:SlyX family protein n=1 Tax=unclassified Ereboglobus TaxID=2626932 RepID=UPI0024051BB7|nr:MULTISPECIES: SlyX family protein [unclassified Ereboglobus]MDF9828153.1 putative coiled-coil protein SlyX [Ereboglobus sp. PH5-10]MDF9832903.1 putative coiled-coil protein SlyX [Ereboglobus sp. PH5-5]